MPRRRGNHTNVHHTFPTSRFTLIKNMADHSFWHQLFGNKGTEEAKEFVRKFADKSGIIDAQLTEREEWKKVFGEAKALDEIETIIDTRWRCPGIVGILIPQEEMGKRYRIVAEYHGDSITLKLISHAREGRTKCPNPATDN